MTSQHGRPMIPLVRATGLHLAEPVGTTVD
jgi:hypothetical protein